MDKNGTNMSDFDNYILLEYFVKQKIAPTMTMRGLRVILRYDKAYLMFNNRGNEYNVGANPDPLLPWL